MYSMFNEASLIATSLPKKKNLKKLALQNQQTFFDGLKSSSHDTENTNISS